MANAEQPLLRRAIQIQNLEFEQYFSNMFQSLNTFFGRIWTPSGYLLDGDVKSSI